MKRLCRPKFKKGKHSYRLNLVSGIPELCNMMLDRFSSVVYGDRGSHRQSDPMTRPLSFFMTRLVRQKCPRP